LSKLVLFLPDGSARDIKLDRERLSIGRRPDNDICLPYPAVSGEHAAIVTILADSFLEDQGSTNGTQVNGRAITKHLLRDRDQIDIGRQRLVYVVDDAATIEAPPGVRTLGEGQAPEARVAGAPRSASRVAGAGALPASRSRRAPGAPATELAVESTAVAAPPAPADLVLRVLTGGSAGRTLPLTKRETLIGRVGVQVAALRRTSDGVRLVPVEGAQGPAVNGATADADGLPVKVGDVIEVAGARIELVAGIAASASSAGAGPD
jgi:predicted component of type VI protein secretion system